MSKALSPVGDAPASSREQHISNTFARLNRTQYQSYDAAASSAAHDPGDSDTPQRAPYHVQDSQEVRQVAHILQQQLRLHVPHVVTRIVDAAEYWPMTRTTRKESHHERVAVRAFSSLTASLPGPFLETNPIMGAAFAPVEKVVLRIVGRSQEWCSNPAAGSWSWYELAKRCIADNGEEVVHAGPIVARNEVLQKKYQTHEVVSYASSSATNAMSDWLRCLRNGDTICLFPKAQYPGWANYTLSATIDVYTCGHTT